MSDLEKLRSMDTRIDHANREAAKDRTDLLHKLQGEVYDKTSTAHPATQLAIIRFQADERAETAIR